MNATPARRELATRKRSWARALAAWLADLGATPNAVSLASIGFACAAGLAFAAGPRFFIAAAACIQLRLLCNMLDGMLAVEGGLRTRTGDVYNELPDRLADVVIFVGAGYGIPHLAGGPALGWSAAVLALLTAYVRALSGSLGLPQHFLGPMAKQHRMFALTLAAICAAIESQLGFEPRALTAGLLLIVLGTAVTVWRRVARLLREAGAR